MDTESSPSPCDTCCKPGACCRGFVISSFGFERERWKQHARNEMRRRGLPFYPVAPGFYNDPSWDYIYVKFNCHWLDTKTGRCRNYDQRPETCRNYEPKQDLLCVEYVMNLKGIPIRTQHGY
jgi:Fe-S-cluster containining protein